MAEDVITSDVFSDVFHFCRLYFADNAVYFEKCRSVQLLQKIENATYFNIGEYW